MNSPVDFTIISSLEQILSSEEVVSKDIASLLKSYGTYKLLEVANSLYGENKIEKDILIYIAHKHYVKMKRSNLSSKIINEFIKIYPDIEYYK